MSEPGRQPTDAVRFRDDDDDDDNDHLRPEAEQSDGDDDDDVQAGPTLPAELLAEAQYVFAMFSDVGGRMNVKHLYKALRAMGVDATIDDVITVVDEYDPNGRGHINSNQWIASVARRLAKVGERCRQLREMLAAGDPKSTGKVTVDYLRAVLNEFDTRLTDVDVNEMVEDCANDSGIVDYDEFMETMVRPAPLDRR